MSPARKFGAIALGLAALAAYQLGDVLFLGRAFFERDLLYYYFPWVEAYVRALGEGALPLRNPTTGFGQPMLGNPSVQALYPLTWLHLLLPASRAFTLITFLHFLVGGTGAAALALRLSASRLAALSAGAFWMASGPFVSGVNVWHHFAGAVWMPWVLAAFHRLLERPDAGRVRVLGALLGLQILAGSGDLCAMTLLLALLMLLVSPPEGGPGRARALLPTLGALVLALSLGAAMWMSVAELVSASVRGRLPRDVRTEWSIHPVAAGEAVLPLQIASLPFTPEARGRLSEGRPPFLRSAFLGVLILPLALVGLATPLRAWRIRVFLGLGIAGALLVALGKHGPLYDGVVAVLPPLSMFRYPSKALFPFSLLACVTAALGLDALREARVRERRLAAAVALVLFGLDLWIYRQGAAVFGPMIDAAGADSVLPLLRHGLALGAATLLLFLAALWHCRPRGLEASAGLGLMATLLINADINVTVPEAVVRYRPAALAALVDPTGGRLYAFDYLRSPGSVPRLLGRPSLVVPGHVRGLDAAATTVVASRDALISPTAAQWGIEYAWDSDALGLFDDGLRGLTVGIQAASGPDLLRRLQIAGVTRAAALHSIGFEVLGPGRALPTSLPDELHMFTVPEPLPRAYATSGARVLPASEASRVVLEPSFDPRTEVTLDAGASRVPSATFRSSVATVERRSERITLDVALSEPGEVVAVDGYLPGWRATVDGAEVPVRRANALFLAADVPAGTHRVVFAYRPTGALVGLAITALTAAALLLSLVRVRS